MKKIFAIIIACIPVLLTAQTAIDAYTLSQNDLIGTARYMSMAGAYGALGGDLSSIGKNPGGIGVYRSSDVGFTLNLDLQSVNTSSQGLSVNTKQTKFSCNNFGYVGAFKTRLNVMPYFNFGISYNKSLSFNRRYKGNMGDISSSLSNYIANVTNGQGYTSYDLLVERNKAGEITYDPYIDSYAPWLSIMGANSYIINPGYYDNNGIGSHYIGLMNKNSMGISEFEVIEEGNIDAFNINLGGNFIDKIYWGVAFGLNSLTFSKYTYYGEAFMSATVRNNDNTLDNDGTASYGLENWLSTSGSGLDFKVGVIYTPINQLRLGLSFHTPTYWTLKDESYASMNYETKNLAGNCIKTGTHDSNMGYIDEVSYKVKTPWKVSASVATVLGSKAIVSFDYERIAYDDMNIKYDDGYGIYSESQLVSNTIVDYYKAKNIFRLGAEYKLNTHFSFRLGYSYETSPVNKDVFGDNMEIMTSGTIPSYCFDKSTQYFTGGLGYRKGGFYTDIAYVHKMKESEYHAFSSYISYEDESWINAPKAMIKDNNNQIVWSIGYRF